MANKFTKSVLERQAKERRAQPAQPVQPAQPIQPEPAPAAEEKEAPQEEAVQPASQPEKKRGRRASLGEVLGPVPDLSQLLSKPQGRQARNKTFYLDAAVIEGLHKAAAAQKMTESKLLNEILKKILGISP